MNLPIELPATPEGVLICTDMSPPSDLAVCRAAALARLLSAPVCMLHVLPTTGVDALRQWLGAGDAVAQRLLDDAQRQVQAQWQRLVAPQPHTPPMQAVVRCGALIGEIKSVIQSLNPLLVVLGAQGESGLMGRVLGTTAQRLLQRSRRSLLVVRRPTEVPYTRVLVPVDFSAWSGQTIRAVRRLMPQAHVVLLHAWSVPFENQLYRAGVELDQLEHYRAHAAEEAGLLLAQLCRDHALPVSGVTLRLVEGDASQVISVEAQALGCDLIAMGKHGNQVAQDLLLGSVCEHVLTQSGCDVLVVNDATLV